MSGWDGRGTPPGVRARLAEPGPVVSHLDVAKSVALESLGFAVVGEAIGYAVAPVPFLGSGMCRAYGPDGRPTLATVTSGEHSRFAGFASYVDALYRGYDRVLGRLTAEAAALGADGVVGVDLRMDELGAHRQFSAVGTAVKADSAVRPAAPFVTDLDAGALTALLMGGWVPVSLAIGLSTSVRHEDPVTARQRRRTNRVNGEITAGTDLVQRTRDDAMRQLSTRMRACGADHVIVSSMSLQVRDVGSGHRDLFAECRVSGTAVTRFASPARSVTTVLPIGRAR